MVNVSVIIPVYNEIRFIQKTLESVIGEADEIILSDNASTDGTSDICQSFANKYPEIKYTRHKENMGSAKNYLFSMDKTEGEYIRIMGGHDLIWPGSTKKMLVLLKNDQTAVIAYQNHSIYFNPDYTINKFFSANNPIMEEKLQSDKIHERVSAIPYGIFDNAMLYSLYRAEVLKKNISKYNFFPGGSTDQGLIVILAREGKILIEKKTCALFMLPRPQNHSEYLKEELQRTTSLLTGKYAYRFAILCEQYNVAKELEMSKLAPKNFAVSLLRKHIPGFLENDFSNFGMTENEEILYVSDEKNNIRKEVLKEIEKYFSKSNKYILLIKIKYFIKLFVPYGLLKLMKKIKDN